MKQLYLAATGQNRGKTTASLGLLDGFIRRGLHAGFMKPVERPRRWKPSITPRLTVVLPRFWPVAAR